MDKKILFITYKKSKNILEGGGQGAKKNYEALCSLVGEQNVDCYYVHDENKKASWWNYLSGAFFTLFNYYYGLTPWRVSKIVNLSQVYDEVFIDRTLFGIIAKKLKKSGYKGKIVSYFHNVEKIYFDAKLPSRLPFRSIMIHCADVNDRYSCEYSDVVVALNERDSQLLEKYYQRKADYLVPVALPDRLQQDVDTHTLTREKPLCLFLGAYFPPNNKGILWFVENVLPQVDIQMKIVGKGMSRLKEEQNSLKDIEVLSDVPDLMPHLMSADLMILPIFEGSGMKVKTCESLMYGKNIIATSEAYEGYEVDYGKVGGKCDTTEEFVKTIKDFCQNPRPRFNLYSRKMYLENYSQEAIRFTYEQFI